MGPQVMGKGPAPRLSLEEELARGGAGRPGGARMGAWGPLSGGRLGSMAPISACWRCARETKRKQV